MIDVIIIGAGCAGLSAAIYVQRAGKQSLVLEANTYGGQIVNTLDIENYPGIAHISGFDFANNLYQQAQNLGTQFAFEEVLEVKDFKDYKEVKTNANTYQAKAIIIATGLQRRKLQLPKEDTLSGRGISYCATCDGAFFKGQDVAINGGGNVALEDAEYLTRFCRKVYLIHRRDTFRADQAEVDKLKDKTNIEYVLNSQVTKLNGETKLESIEVTDRDGNQKTLDVVALFIAIGQIPMNQIFKGLVNMDEAGFIVTDEQCRTSVEGIYAAGDCRQKTIRQLATAASDGAIAALNACNAKGGY